MTHLGVAHLSGRKSNVFTGAGNEGMRPGCPQLIPGWGIGLGDGVIGAVFSVTETVQNDQQTDSRHVHSRVNNCRATMVANFPC